MPHAFCLILSSHLKEPIISPTGCDLILSIITPSNDPPPLPPSLPVPPSFSNQILFLTKTPKSIRTVGSAIPLLWGQITRSWMAGDNTFCSPLIGPPLGVCVCHMCVFQAYICIHSPVFRIRKKPTQPVRDWGKEEGEVEDRVGE